MKQAFILIILLGILVLIPMAVVLSAPQAAWVKYERNPVLSPGAAGTWDDRNVFSAEILLDHTTYKMWYSGASYLESRSDIGYATSPSGLSWTKSANNPVLRHGSAGTWDSGGVSAPTVLYDTTAGLWKMWFSGVSQIGGGFRIGYATSPDGIVWTKRPTPVLDVTADGADDSNVLSPDVIYKDGLYRMWYAGRGERNQIFHATSVDGINWTKYAGNPIVLLGGDLEWDNGEISAPSILVVGTGYEMWYQGYSRSTLQHYIGHATSPDGTTWTKDGLNPIMGIEPNAWDSFSVYYPSVGIFNGQLMMWYHGEPQAFGVQKIGLALMDPSAIPTPRPTFPSLPPDTTTPDPDPEGTVTPAPSNYGVIINDGAFFTNQINVALKIKAPDTSPQMMVSNDSSFAGSQWEPFGTTKAWALNPAGSYSVPRKVYVQLGDAAGSTQAVVLDDIKLDVTPPTGTIVVLKAALIAAGVNANTLALQIEDDVSGVADMRISNESDLAGAAWEAFTISKSWTFDERGVVYGQFRDRAGNVSAIVQGLLAEAKDPSLFFPYTARH